jgi:hypothetical protein
MRDKLEGIAVGVEVAYSAGSWSSVSGVIVSKVKRVLPSGRFEAGNITFNPDGRSRGGDSYGHQWAHIATDEDRANDLHRRLLIRAKKLQMEVIPLARWSNEQLQAYIDTVSKMHPHE